MEGKRPHSDGTTPQTRRKRAKQKRVPPFLVRIKLPFTLELLQSDYIYVLCKYTTQGLNEWNLSVIDEQLDNLLLPQVLKHAVPFTLDEHTVETFSPHVRQTDLNFVAENFSALKHCELVGISGTNAKGWQGEGFFHPAYTPACRGYISRMREKTPELPLIARGALFHWVMLRMAGFKAVDGGVKFKLIDEWRGKFILNKDQQDLIKAEVHEVMPNPQAEWAAAGEYQITSNMLRRALTPNYRARLWLYYHGKEGDAASKAVKAGQYAMKHWDKDASATHEYYARAVDDVLARMQATAYETFAAENAKIIESLYPGGLTQTRAAKAFIAALYIDRRAKSFEQKLKKGKIHAIDGAKRHEGSPMFANGIYSAMQEAHLDQPDDALSQIVFDTMPQLVATNLSQPVRFKDHAHTQVLTTRSP